MTSCARCKDGPLDVEAVAAIMGMKPATVRQKRWRQTIPPEDGMVAGHPYWWPATIAAWTKNAPAAGR